MKTSLKIKPVSVNAAYRGRRFKTPLYARYERDVLMLLKGQETGKLSGDLSVPYVFYLKHYTRTDVGNLEKCLTDIIVKSGIIKDDMYVKDIHVRKERATEDSIEIEITECT